MQKQALDIHIFRYTYAGITFIYLFIIIYFTLFLYYLKSIKMKLKNKRAFVYLFIFMHFILFLYYLDQYRSINIKYCRSVQIFNFDYLRLDTESIFFGTQGTIYLINLKSFTAFQTNILLSSFIYYENLVNIVSIEFFTSW